MGQAGITGIAGFGKWRFRAVALLGLALAGAVPHKAVAAETVDLLLVLAADVSRSIDEGEFKLQREGYARAFTNPRVLNAIRAGEHQAIAVTFVEWAGDGEQRTVVDWTVIHDGENGATFAAEVLAAPRSFAGHTSISAAIDFGVKRFSETAIKSDRHVIDISGDGTSNAGRDVTEARDQAVAKGITINGLTIINNNPNFFYPQHTHPPGGLPSYYRQNVIGGAAAFLVEVEGFATFGDALVSKLVGEIASLPRTPRQLAAAR